MKELWKINIRLRCTIILLGMICIPVISLADNKKPEADIKNVIFIILDALRADHLGCYGYLRNTSPNIDRLARHGIVFDRAVVQAGYTKSSVPSYFTSTYPSVHQVITADDIFPKNLMTMAGIFKENGYFTLSFYNNINIHLRYNFNRSFDIYQSMGGPESNKASNDIKIINNLLSILTRQYIDFNRIEKSDVQVLNRFLNTSKTCNLMKNPGFENGAASWNLRKDWREKGLVHTGKYSIHVDKDIFPQSDFWQLNQKVILEHGTEYVVGAFIKTKNLEGNIGINIKEESGETASSIIKSYSISGDNDWTLLFRNYKPSHCKENLSCVPPLYETKAVVFPARITDYENGEFWVDDVFLIPYDYLPPMSYRLEKESIFSQYLQSNRSKNLVRNYGFDSEEFFWASDGFKTVESDLSGKAYHIDKNKISDSVNKDLEQAITISPDTTYIFGAFAKTENLNSEVFVEVETEGGNFRSTGLKGDNKWTLMWGVIPSVYTDMDTRSGKPVQAKIKPARMDDFISGRLWLDNVFMLSLADIPAFRPAEKLFCYLHFIDPHSPYYPPEEYLNFFSKKDGASLIDRYDAEIRALDARLGILLEKLEESGVMDETLLILTADHGEAFGEHGKWRHPPDSFYDETVRVPLIFYNPLLFPSPQRVEETVQASVDLLPSLIKLLDLKVPPGVNFQGSSYFPLGSGSSPYAFFYQGPYLKMVTTNKWKYISDEYYSFIEGLEIKGKNTKDGQAEITIISPTGENSAVFASEGEFQKSDFLHSCSPNVQKELEKVYKAVSQNQETFPVREKAMLFNLEDDSEEKINMIERYPEKARELQQLIRKQIIADRVFRDKTAVVSGGKKKLTNKIKEEMRALGYMN